VWVGNIDIFSSTEFTPHAKFAQVGARFHNVFWVTQTPMEERNAFATDWL
jgi:hypothetical protein